LFLKKNIRYITFYCSAQGLSTNCILLSLEIPSKPLVSSAESGLNFGLYFGLDLSQSILKYKVWS